MLPGSVGQPGIGIGDPLIRRLFSARGTESRLAGMRSIKNLPALETEKPVEAENLCSADQQLDDIGDYGSADEMMLLQEKFPPVAIIKKNVPNLYCAA
jgi:hypothetical protein